jgi:hypothetical protein
MRYSESIMNDDFNDYLLSIKHTNSYTSELYDLMRSYKEYQDYIRKNVMPYYYEDTQSKEVATAVLDAYANGVEFETLIKNNKTIRQYWYGIQAEKAKAEQSREKEKIRLAKLAEKRAEEKAKREEVMSKLSKEELEAFGLIKKGKR